MASHKHGQDQECNLSSTTLFARNLPFTIESKDLENVFSEIGPVKRCFVVKDKENPGKCRGFGYITFALKEDAVKAKETVRHVNGRKVFLTFSNKKPRHRQRGKPEDTMKDEDKKDDEIDTNNIPSEILSSAELGENDEKSKHKPKSKRSSASNADGRTVVLSGFPSTVNVKQLKKACKKIGELEQLTYPVENYEQPTAHALFKSHKVARVAVNKLNGKTVKGSVLTAVLCSKENKEVSMKSLKKSRLIIRNLPFKCSKEILMNEFSKFGDISEVVLPTKSVGKKKKKLGFAFVQFKTVFDAAKALETMNQKQIKGRPIAVDWTLPKKKYQLLKVSDEVEKDAGDQPLDKDEADEEEMGSIAEGEPVTQNSGGEESEIEENHDGDDGDDDDDDGGDDGDDGGDDDDDDDDGEEKEEENIEKAQKKKKKLRDAREGKTVFVRNIPFDAGEEEICSLFEKFGKIAYCKIVVDDVTEHSRGSAFVKFEEKESADDCLRKCGDGDDNEISLRNRPLSVTLAVPRGKIPQLLAERDSEKKSPRDKRNLYLAKEGVISAGSEAAVGLSKSDLQKRQKAEAEKKAKLKIPHYIVSKTRLCFRNLPLNVDNKKLSEVLRKVCDGKPKKVGKVNIMRSVDRLDSSGVGRSKGFGFAEFSTHEDALEVLRTTNNNPEIFGPERRPIVDFAIENSLILKSQELRKTRNLQKVKKSGGQEEDKRKLENGKGIKRKWDKKERNDSEGHTDGFNKKTINPRKRQAANETNTKDNLKKGKAKNNLESKHEPKKKDRKPFDTKTRVPNVVDMVHSHVNSDKTLVQTNEASLRSKHKKKMKANQEEENFNKIVEKYKSKLFGENTKQLKNSRWFQ